MKIGILGLQGCCVPHQRKFAALGVDCCRVVFPEDITGIDGLVMPGGESSTMLKAAPPGLWSTVSDFAETRPIWGVCAGCILLARHVDNPSQESLGLMSIDVRRNAYGTQNDSFIDDLELNLTEVVHIEAIFIRAPQILQVDDDVKVLGKHGGHPVMVESRHHLATTFHPELHESMAVHEYFIEKVMRHSDG